MPKADVFSAIADPTRRALLRRLAEEGEKQERTAGYPPHECGDRYQQDNHKREGGAH